MTCPKCLNASAVGAYCQRCGFGLVDIPVVIEKKWTDADVANLTRAAEKRASDLFQRGTELGKQYAALLREHNTLKLEHAALKANLAEISPEIAKDAAPDGAAAHDSAMALPSRPIVNCPKCDFADGAYVQHECNPKEPAA